MELCPFALTRKYKISVRPKEGALGKLVVFSRMFTFLTTCFLGLFSSITTWVRASWRTSYVLETRDSRKEGLSTQAYVDDKTLHLP